METKTKKNRCRDMGKIAAGHYIRGGRTETLIVYILWVSIRFKFDLCYGRSSRDRFEEISTCDQ